LQAKLAEWIGENLNYILGFPDKADQRAETGWTPAELKHILHAHAVPVDSALTSFGYAEWESQLFRDALSTRCYSFNLPKKRFHSATQRT
jgi:hypothetical protein